MCGELCWTFETYFNATAIIDIAFVAAVFFALSLLLRGTQAVPLLRGVLVVLLIVGLTATVLPFTAMRWLLSNVITVLAIAIPIILQPELRRLMERLGRSGVFTFGRPRETEAIRMKVIDEICTAAARLSERRHGALIVIERDTTLQEYIDTGVLLDSEVSPQLLLTIFWPKTELHDGAVILRGGKIAAAACVLPLASGRQFTDRKLGTRHRAALGISEVSDGICVVVSEETGAISVANGGRMIRRLDATRLKTVLQAFYGESEQTPRLPTVIRGLLQRGNAAPPNKPPA